MKTLLKISLCFALCSFVAMSVSAVEPVTPPATDATGTITVTVVEFLELAVTSPNAKFIYDEHGNTDDLSTKTSVVEINASCDWTFSVNANAEALTDGDKAPIALSVISYDINGVGAVALTEDGTTYNGGLNTVPTFNVDWTADFSGLGNIYAGEYKVGVTYAVVKR